MSEVRRSLSLLFKGMLNALESELQVKTYLTIVAVICFSALLVEPYQLQLIKSNGMLVPLRTSVDLRWRNE